MNCSELKSNEERFLLISTYVDHASDSEVIMGKSSKITSPGRTPGISYQLLLSPAVSVRANYNLWFWYKKPGHLPLLRGMLSQLAACDHFCGLTSVAGKTVMQSVLDYSLVVMGIVLKLWIPWWDLICVLKISLYLRQL